MTDPLQPHIDQLVAMGWEYSEATDDQTGARAIVLHKDDERIRLTMGVTTEGGLRAFIGFDDAPSMVRERRDARGGWHVVSDDGDDKSPT